MLLDEEIKILQSMEKDENTKFDIEEAIDHGVLVSNLAVNLARELGMDDEFCYDIAIAGILHDIGKLKLGNYLYGRRKENLKIEEMRYVRMHSTLGYEILKETGKYSDRILSWVLHHHENCDGSGYPGNLKEKEIPYGAKILRVCDVFSALVSIRPYRAAFDIEQTIELMIDEVKNFDMQVFLAFMKVVNDESFETIKSFINSVNEHSEKRNRIIAAEKEKTDKIQMQQ